MISSSMSASKVQLRDFSGSANRGFDLKSTSRRYNKELQFFQDVVAGIAQNAWLRNHDDQPKGFNLRNVLTRTRALRVNFADSKDNSGFGVLNSGSAEAESEQVFNLPGSSG
jgi:hypothetical protein